MTAIVQSSNLISSTKINNLQGPICKMSTLVQLMAYRHIGLKQLPEPMATTSYDIIWPQSHNELKMGHVTG